MAKIKHLRWWICGLLFIATSLSFLDRQVLSVVAPVVTKEFNMDNTAYSQAVSWFLVSYMVMFLLGGRIIDWLGTRMGLLLSVVVWSISSAAHGVVNGAAQLGAARFFLGMGEGGCFPGAIKGAAEWFPQKERAFATGIAIGGAAFGAVVAPPLTVWAMQHVGWRGAFFATGIIGLLWALLWWLFFQQPKDSKLITDSEREYIASGQEESAAAPGKNEKRKLVPFRVLLRLKEVWGLGLIRFLIDPVFYFYMFWIPKYLYQERGVSMERIGELTWIPFFALGVFNIAGGWITDLLIKRGMPVAKTRRLVMTISGLLTPVSVLAAYASTAEVAIAFMALLMLAHGFFITNFATVVSDLFDSRSVSTVFGFSGTLGGLGGYLSTIVTGPVVDNFSFLPVWIASGCMYPLALVVLYTMIGKIRRIELA